jgi:hypothetical protein
VLWITWLLVRAGYAKPASPSGHSPSGHSPSGTSATG